MASRGNRSACFHDGQLHTLISPPHARRSPILFWYWHGFVGMAGFIHADELPSRRTSFRRPADISRRLSWPALDFPDGIKPPSGQHALKCARRCRLLYRRPCSRRSEPPRTRSRARNAHDTAIGNGSGRCWRQLIHDALMPALAAPSGPYARSSQYGHMQEPIRGAAQLDQRPDRAAPARLAGQPLPHLRAGRAIHQLGRTALSTTTLLLA